MKEEAARWMKYAREDFSTAKANFKIKKYKFASFLCQQAAEKALKAVLLKNTGKIIKTHDLVLLARKLNAPENIIEGCKKLTPVYVETRYPLLGDEEFKKFTKKEVEEDIKRMEMVVRWAKGKL